MAKVKKLKLKGSVIHVLKIIGVILVICLAIFIFYRSQVKSLTSIGYSEKASNFILFSMKKDYALSKGENKTLNAAFESEDYKEEYLDNYSKINYHNHKHLIKNINTLIKRGYSNNHINIILSHGNDSDITEFAKKDKVKYLEEFYYLDYAKIRYYDEYVEYSTTTGEDEETTVLYINLGMDGEAYKDVEVVDEFNHTMLVNKYRKLDENFEPYDLSDVPDEYSARELQASKMAIDAFIEMAKAAEKEDLGILINYAYRSYNTQVELCEEYKKLYGPSYVDKYIPYPGHSEHQTGLALDIRSKTTSVFAESDEYDWVVENAYKYGFIMRFTNRGKNITGFKEEPWHIRFVGKTASEYIHKHRITYEEYYAMFVDLD